jgi:vacuolar-type H+-ATPase subunit E/Vma4
MNGPMGGLEPVRAALLARARADAAAVDVAASRAAARTLADAQKEVARITAGARESGEREARAALAADRMRVRRQARGTVLAAQREGYEQLRTAARAALRLWGTEAAAREALVRKAREVLGPDAVLRDAPGGGILAEHAGRRLDLSLDALADRALEAVHR